MTCHEFERSLEALLEGALGDEDRARHARHAAACAACGELLAPMRDTLEPVAIPPPPSFLAAVLAATTGPACATASSWLCALVDGELNGTERSLAQGHLAACDACRSEAECLSNLAAELPSMAEVAPDAAFLREAVQVPAMVFAPDVVVETWRRWMLRPRFAVEAAYVGVTLSCLIVLSPVPPLPGLLRQASRARAIVSNLRSDAGILFDRASSLLEAAERPASAAPVDPSGDPKE